MPHCFFDTSALAKRYYEENGSKAVDAIIEDDEYVHIIETPDSSTQPFARSDQASGWKPSRPEVRVTLRLHYRGIPERQPKTHDIGTDLATPHTPFRRQSRCHIRMQ